MMHLAKYDRPGRPVKTHVHPAVQERICYALRMGAPYRIAAQYGGVTYQTLRNWINRAEAGDEGFISFVQAIEHAEAVGAVFLLQCIRKAAENPRYWRAAAWILERRWPEHYGRYRPAPPPVITEIRFHRVEWPDEGDKPVLLVEGD